MEIEKIVKKILEDVRKNGDKAVIKYTYKFDHIKLTPRKLKIPKEELETAWQNTPPHVKRVLQTAKRNIERFHTAQLPREWKIEPEEGVTLGQIFRPVSKVGVYVPGGRAPLVSTVFMTVVPAVISGVPDIIITTPPPVNRYILAAAFLAGAKCVYQVGGVQAIGAMAYGTKTIPKVDKIVGPGNIFVTAAKKLVFGDVDIDMLAGPSEILIIADETARADFIKYDLLSQLEHDPLSKAILVTTSPYTIKGVRIIKASSLDEAVAISNRLAPEHLQLMVRNPARLIPKIKNAGIILIGQYTPVAVSDFIAGVNHVLPTNGTARSFGGLSVWNFLKPISIVQYTKQALSKIKPYIKTFSKIEELPMHGRSVDVR